MLDHRSLPALAAILLSACFNPSYPEGRPCGTDGWCPPGQGCFDQVCWPSGYVPPRPDAAVLDDGNAELAELAFSVPGLTPAFDPAVTEYTLSVSKLVRSVHVTARPAHPGATLRVAEDTTEPDQPSQPITVASTTTVPITVAAPAGNEKTYLVHVQKDGNLAQYLYGKADNAGRDDYFGWRLAIDGDTLAVASSYESSCTTGVHPMGDDDDGCQGSGAVYVFRRRGGAWAPEAYLKPSNTEDSDDEFGVSLALDGDTIVVGAFHEDSGSAGVNSDDADNSLTDSGAAYVFHRDDGIWKQEAYLKPETPAKEAHFGWSVAVAGDLVAVGARLEDVEDTTDGGAVYLFRRDLGQWIEEARLTALAPEENAFFGYSLAAGEDIVVVGACGHGCPPSGRDIENPQSAGSVHVFRRGETSWDHEAEILSPNPDAEDAFGYSVALAADTIVVGAPREDSSSLILEPGEDDDSSSASGAAYVFQRAGTVWDLDAYLKAMNTEVADRFGSSVAIAGALVAVGALGEDSDATGIDGNTNDNDEEDSGAVYLYGRDGSTWSALAYIKASNTGAGNEFGTAVAMSDDALVVGAPFESGSDTMLVPGDMGGDDDGPPDSGAFYLFH